MALQVRLNYYPYLSSDANDCFFAAQARTCPGTLLMLPLRPRAPGSTSRCCLAPRDRRNASPLGPCRRRPVPCLPWSRVHQRARTCPPRALSGLGCTLVAFHPGPESCCVTDCLPLWTFAMERAVEQPDSEATKSASLLSTECHFSMEREPKICCHSGTWHSSTVSNSSAAYHLPEE